MSNSDSFIDEVSDELRRDRLYHALRRYGWIAVVAVIALVAAAGWNEWRKAQAAADAQVFGDALLAALDGTSSEDRAAALRSIDVDGPRAALVAMLAAQGEGGPSAEALLAIATDPDVPPVYRDLAMLKNVMARQSELDASEAEALLAPLVQPGAPFRLLAQEQAALARAGDGDADGALEILSAILADGDVTRDLRRRAQQMTVALGGTLGAP